jgi:hypothetical protein
MEDFIKNNGIVILIGVAILLGVTWLSTALFGDLTSEDSFKPLWVIVPVFVAVIGYLIYQTNKTK